MTCHYLASDPLLIWTAFGILACIVIAILGYIIVRD